jgi:hypothetical protein
MKADRDHLVWAALFLPPILIALSPPIIAQTCCAALTSASGSDGDRAPERYS